MSKNAEILKTEVARYRAMRALSLIRALGFTLVLILFAGIRERLETCDVPAPFKGSSIAMITAGLMSLAFMGFSGLVK